MEQEPLRGRIEGGLEEVWWALRFVGKALDPLASEEETGDALFHVRDRVAAVTARGRYVRAEVRVGSMSGAGAVAARHAALLAAVSEATHEHPSGGVDAWAVVSAAGGGGAVLVVNKESRVVPGPDVLPFDATWRAGKLLGLVSATELTDAVREPVWASRYCRLPGAPRRLVVKGTAGAVTFGDVQIRLDGAAHLRDWQVVVDRDALGALVEDMTEERVMILRVAGERPALLLECGGVRIELDVLPDGSAEPEADASEGLAAVAAATVADEDRSLEARVSAYADLLSLCVRVHGDEEPLGKRLAEWANELLRPVTGSGELRLALRDIASWRNAVAACVPAEARPAHDAHIAMLRELADAPIPGASFAF